MLTATQVKYAQGRVSSIYNDKLSALSDKYSGNQKQDIQEQLNKLRRGDYTIVEGDFYRWYEAVRFNKPEPLMSKEEYNKARADLKNVRDTLMDQLVLGDAEEAIKGLEKLQAYVI